MPRGVGKTRVSTLLPAVVHHVAWEEPAFRRLTDEGAFVRMPHYRRMVGQEEPAFEPGVNLRRRGIRLLLSDVGRPPRVC
jgi:hypothetical protein